MPADYTQPARTANHPARGGFQAAKTGLAARWTMQILVAAAAGMTVLLALWPSAGHDQLWLLLVAARTGPGLDPYRQVFEANPPLAAWLSRGVLLLAAGLHVPAPVLLKALTLLLAAGVAAGGWRVLRQVQPVPDPVRRWFLLCVAVLVFGAMPARDFAQRDHVLVLLVLPYLLLTAVPGAALSTRAGVALLAALGVALKPHQVLILLAVEGYVLVRTRRPRLLEPGLFLATGAAYWIAIVRITPEFLREVLPVLRDTYWANGALSLSGLLLQSVQLHLLAILAFVFFFRSRRRSPSAVLLVAGVAATGAYYLQDTGWYYHQIPALTMFALALALQVVDDPGFWRFPEWAPWGAGALAGLALGLTWHFMQFRPIALVPVSHTPLLRVAALDPPQEVPSPLFYAGLGPGAPVMTLTPTVDDAIMPVELYRLTLAQRYPQFWMLPALLRGEAGDVPQRHRLTPERLAGLIALQQRMMREDLDRWHPELILVERCQDPAVLCQAIEARHYDLLQLFLADPGFRQRFSRYTLVQRIGPYDAYRLRAP